MECMSCGWRGVDCNLIAVTLTVACVQSGSILRSLQAEVVNRFKVGSTPPSSTALMAILHFIVGGTSGTGFLLTLQTTVRELRPTQPEVRLPS